MSFKLRRFPIETMKNDRIVLIFGKRGTGKTVLLRDIMYNLRNGFDVGIAMSPTVENVEMFSEHLPGRFVYDDLAKGAIETVVNTAKALSQAKKVRNFVVVMDDCMYDKDALKGKSIMNLFMNGRHYNVCFINCVQYMMTMNAALRSQIDYVFVLRESSRKNRKKLWEDFFAVFSDFGSFNRVFESATRNFSALVVDNTVQSSSASDTVFWYKATYELPPFRMFKPFYWQAERFATEHRAAIKDALAAKANPEAGMAGMTMEIDTKINTVECVGGPGDGAAPASVAGTIVL